MSTAVIDTNIIIHASTRPLTHDTLLTVPSVTRELKSEQSKRRFNTSTITVQEPRDTYMKKVEDEANKSTLDLSNTDKELIALALETDATLVTDDKFMQETAYRLNISVEGFQNDTINQSQTWHWVCKRCRADLTSETTCPYCNGSPIRVTQ